MIRVPRGLLWIGFWGAMFLAGVGFHSLCKAVSATAIFITQDSTIIRVPDYQLQDDQCATVCLEDFDREPVSVWFVAAYEEDPFSTGILNSFFENNDLTPAVAYRRLEFPP